MIVSPRNATLAATLCAVCGIFACRDITSPISREPSPNTAVLTKAPGTVIVSPDSMHGWGFYDDQRGVACTDTSVCHMAEGPIGQPAGSGSAELATTASTDGKALILADYKGTRLDHITELRYSTYRQSVNPGNNLAIALQLNVDYDLSDQTTSYQGRLVYEPYQSGASVVQNSWKNWDAKAGKWWGTRATVKRGDADAANSCVQSSPCTWAQLLSMFPNLGVHAAYGAVVLKAGSGWTGFRGNVDALAIGVDGTTLTYDFEVGPRLVADIGPGVLGTRLPAESTYTAGAIVEFAFAAAPGRSGPFVLIDDSLAGPQGSIVMDRPRRIQVVADTVYSLAHLRPAEQELATYMSALITSSDKTTAFLALAQYQLDRSTAGVSAEQMAHEQAVVSYLVAATAQDDAALAAVDSALAGTIFTVKVQWDGKYRIAVFDGDYYVPGTSRSGLVQPRLNQAGASRTPTASSMSTRLAPPSSAALARLESTAESVELLRVIYVNGQFTDSPDGAYADGAVRTGDYFLKPLLREAPEFQGYVEWDWVYNPTLRAELKEWDRTHSCEYQRLRGLRVLSWLQSMTAYALCKGTRAGFAAYTFDFSESLRERIELHQGLPPVVPVVRSLAEHLATARRMGRNVLTVAHSQGNLVVAQALRELPALEGGPLQGNRCIASLALASAATRESYPLDDNHLSGFVVEGDIIRASFPGPWESLNTSSSDSAAAIIAATPLSDRPKVLLEQGMRLHSINDTYLTDPIARAQVKGRMARLLRECLPQRLEFSPQEATLRTGETVTIESRLFNFNGREMPERKAFAYSLDGLLEDQGDGKTFRATRPRSAIEPLRIHYENIQDSLPVQVPLVQFDAPTVKDGSSSFWARLEAGTNGGSDQPVPPPEGQWPQTLSASSCGTTVRRDGPPGWAGANYAFFTLVCNRRYVVTAVGVLNDPQVAPLVGAYQHMVRNLDGEVTALFEGEVNCGGAAHCVTGFFSYATDVAGYRIAYTDDTPPPPATGDVPPGSSTLRTPMPSPTLSRGRTAATSTRLPVSQPR